LVFCSCVNWGHGPLKLWTLLLQPPLHIYSFTYTHSLSLHTNTHRQTGSVSQQAAPSSPSSLSFMPGTSAGKAACVYVCMYVCKNSIYPFLHDEKISIDHHMHTHIYTNTHTSTATQRFASRHNLWSFACVCVCVSLMLLRPTTAFRLLAPRLASGMWVYVCVMCVCM
jgi:hypothetical protein